MSAKYIINENCNGIEIYFDDRPQNEILVELHESKWRWHKKKRCWYIYDSDRTRNQAKKLCNQYNKIYTRQTSYYSVTNIYSTTECYDDFDPSEWDEESLLRRNGYTVSQEEGLSTTERQRILTQVIRNRIMTPGQVINHIERMVNLRAGQRRYDIACKKWREDIYFVMNNFK